jgi:TAT (twin-arginine translocation) pathway signal sequence
MPNYSRRSFLKTAGAATGMAAISASPAVAAAIEPGAVETTPSGPVPHEPVIAIVRDASLGEVTIMNGTTETTYKDAWLVKRLMKASQSRKPMHYKGVA